LTDFQLKNEIDWQKNIFDRVYRKAFNPPFKSFLKCEKMLKIAFAVAIFVHAGEITRAENFILLQARREKSPGRHILSFFFIYHHPNSTKSLN